MSDSTPLWRTLLDGRYRWGTATRQTGRYGAESIHLRIYPPGSSTIMRRFARITRLWPFAGAGLTLLAGLLVPALVDVTTSFAFITTMSFVIVIWGGAGLDIHPGAKTHCLLPCHDVDAQPSRGQPGPL